MPIVIALYGLICCGFLAFYEEIPKEDRKYFKSSFTIFEYAAFTFIFWFNFKNEKIRKIIIALSVAFVAFQIFYVLTGKVRRLDYIPIVIETILLLIYIIYFFYTFSSRINSPFIYNHYVFWFALGILIYLGGSFFFFILFEQLTEGQIEQFGKLTYVAEIIKNILFSVALFMYARTSFENQKKTKNIPYLDMI